MKRYFRIMLGRSSIFAPEAHAGGYVKCGRELLNQGSLPRAVTPAQSLCEAMARNLWKRTLAKVA
jgi:hypothetical protein